LINANVSPCPEHCKVKAFPAIKYFLKRCTPVHAGK
jgi:hypothetical protein